MDEFINNLRETYDIWDKQIRPYINKSLHFIFRGAMHAISQKAEPHNEKEKPNYAACARMLKVIENCFSPDNYKNEKWGPAANQVWQRLSKLEQTALKLAS